GPAPPGAVTLWPAYAVLKTAAGNEPPPVRAGVTVGQVTVSVAALLLAVPQALVNTARYWLPLCESCAVKVRLVFVSPTMSVKPEPVLTCHCTVGAGVPLAAAVKVTLLPACTLWVSGWVVTTGVVLTVSVAAVVVAVPQALVKTARYLLPF